MSGAANTALALSFGSTPSLTPTTASTTLPFICEVDVAARLVDSNTGLSIDGSRPNANGILYLLTKDGFRNWLPLCTDSSTSVITVAAGVACKQMGYSLSSFAQIVPSQDTSNVARYQVTSCAGTGALRGLLHGLCGACVTVTTTGSVRVCDGDDSRECARV